MDAFRKLFTIAFLTVAILPLSNALAHARPTDGSAQTSGNLATPAALLPERKRHAMRAKFAQLTPAERAVARDLMALERLYRRQGKILAIEALYGDLLKRTQNDALRHFAARRLAKTAVNKGDLASAETHLRASLAVGLKQF